jgi:NAD(P)-dependent dehydrogenase (short-subunit alcohol dehydrogenase family)
MPALNGKTAIVTGGNSGIGYETAKALYDAGANVIVAGRNVGQIKRTVEEIRKVAAENKIEPATLDLGNLRSVREFADRVRSATDRLDILINNAGIMAPPPGRTADGFELQFGINHIGHFCLAAGLYPLIRNAAGGRIVSVTSLAYTTGSIDFYNLRLEKEYDAQREHAQSKLANLLFAIELQRKIDRDGDAVLSVAVHPGLVDTCLTRHMTKEAVDAIVRRSGPLMPASLGALPSLFAATSPDARGGHLYGPDGDGGLRGYPAETPIDPLLLRDSLGEQLWSFCNSATGCAFFE